MNVKLKRVCSQEGKISKYEGGKERKQASKQASVLVA